MLSVTRTNTIKAPLAGVAFAALMGVTMLASPLTAARAGQPTQTAQAASTKSAGAQAATDTKAETVEQRITALHASLKITPGEDALWNDVAQSMRENASNMEKLVATERTTAPESKTAPEDLKTYAKFAQAHVDGLKNLTSSFDKLYAAMTDDQKKNADTVFRGFGHEAGASHS